MHVKQVQFHRIISPVLHSASSICATSLKNVCTYLFTLLLKHLLMFHFLMGNISWVRISVGCLFRHRVARLCTQLYLKCYLFFLNGLEQLTSSLQVLEYFRHVILQMTEHIEKPFLIRLGLSLFFITSLHDPCFSSMVLT